MAYLHGVETTEIQKGARPITVANSSVIGLVGTAPKGKPDEVIRILSKTQAIEVFGDRDGYTIPEAMNAIYAQGPATVLVVNVNSNAHHQDAAKKPSEEVVASSFAGVEAPIKVGTVLQKGLYDVDVEVAAAAAEYTDGDSSKDYSITDVNDGEDRVLTITWNQQVIPEEIKVKCTVDLEEKSFTLTSDMFDINKKITHRFDGKKDKSVTGVKIIDTKLADHYEIDKKQGVVRWISEGDLEGKTIPGKFSITLKFKADHATEIPSWNTSTTLPLKVDAWDVEVSDDKRVYAENVDFIVYKNATGKQEVKWISDKNKPTVKVSYKYTGYDKYDYTTENAEIKSSFDKFESAYMQLGLFPKILIAPRFCEEINNLVAAKMVSVAKKLRAVALIDSKTVDTSDPRGSFHSTSSERAILCAPYVKVGKDAKKEDIKAPLSQYLAGVIAAKDSEKGYWWSPSNTTIQGITGLSQDLTASITDENSDVNILNAAGIVTVFNSFGTGFRIWGNRSASYPSNQHFPSISAPLEMRVLINEFTLSVMPSISAVFIGISMN